MTKKIEVMNSVTGEVIQVSPSTKLSALIGGTGYSSADDIAADIHANMKGVSVAKIAEIIVEIIAKGNGFFEGIQQLRDGDAAPKFRLVIDQISDSPSDVRATPEPEAEDLDPVDHEQSQAVAEEKSETEVDEEPERDLYEDCLLYTSPSPRDRG